MLFALSFLSLTLSYIHTRTDTDSNPLKLLFMQPFFIPLLHLGKIAALQEKKAMKKDREIANRIT